MRKTKIFAMVSTLIFAANFIFPLTSFGQGTQSQQGTQEVSAGNLVLLDVPDAFSFPGVPVSATAHNVFYGISNFGGLTDTSLRLQVRDLRNDGGFIVTTRATEFTDTYTGTGFDSKFPDFAASPFLENQVYLGTTHDPNGFFTINAGTFNHETETFVGDTAGWTLGADVELVGGTRQTSDLLNLTTFDSNGNLNATLWDASATGSGSGFAGEFSVYGNFGAALNAVEAGTYTTTFIYDLAASSSAS